MSASSSSAVGSTTCASRRVATNSQGQGSGPSEEEFNKWKPKDLGWNYEEKYDKENPEKVECKLCGKRFSGGVHIVKEHIGHVQGNILPCPKSTPEDQEICFNSIEAAKDMDSSLSLELGRPKNGGAGGGGESRWHYLTKALFNVKIQNSLGPVQVVMPQENTATELVKAAIAIHMKEKRRPLLESSDPGCYDLHYSQFTLECLKPEEKLMDLGSRNFFLCPKVSSL